MMAAPVILMAICFTHILICLEAIAARKNLKKAVDRLIEEIRKSKKL